MNRGDRLLQTLFKRHHVLMYGSLGSQGYLPQLVLLGFQLFDQKLRPYNTPSLRNANHTQQAYDLCLFFNKDELFYNPNVKTITGYSLAE